VDFTVSCRPTGVNAIVLASRGAFRSIVVALKFHKVSVRDAFWPVN
jgi:hypothetical protein